MPIYEVQAPDRCIYTLEGPAGVTQDQLLAEVIRQFPRASIFASSSPAECPSTGPVPPGINETASVVPKGSGLGKTDPPGINETTSVVPKDSGLGKADLQKAGGDALASTLGFGLLGALFFWLVARRLMKVPRATPNQLGIWWGAWLGALAILVTGGNSVHLGWQEVLYREALLTPVYFIIGYVIGYGFRKINPLNPLNSASGTVRWSDHSESSVINDDLYLRAMSELDTGQQDKGLWARCFAETDGDLSKTKAAYIRRRVEILAKRG